MTSPLTALDLLVADVAYDATTEVAALGFLRFLGLTADSEALHDAVAALTARDDLLAGVASPSVVLGVEPTAGRRLLDDAVAACEDDYAVAVAVLARRAAEVGAA